MLKWDLKLERTRPQPGDRIVVELSMPTTLAKEINALAKERGHPTFVDWVREAFIHFENPNASSAKQMVTRAIQRAVMRADFIANAVFIALDPRTAYINGALSVADHLEEDKNPTPSEQGVQAKNQGPL